MKCPYCDREMRLGTLSGDGRKKLHWKEGNKKPSFGDLIAGIGQVKGVRYGLASFKIDAWYCKNCRKIIMDTEVDE